MLRNGRTCLLSVTEKKNQHNSHSEKKIIARQAPYIFYYTACFEKKMPCIFTRFLGSVQIRPCVIFISEYHKKMPSTYSHSKGFFLFHVTKANVIYKIQL